MISLHHLPNQQRGEKTVIFLRRHWIEVLTIFLYFLGFLLIPAAFYLIILSTGTDITNILWQTFGILGICTYSIVGLLLLMTMFTDYYLDTWIVTSERIVNIEQLGLFSRVISTLHLNQVQDVTAETHGFFSTIFTFGNVHIQTAGSTERFNFKNVDNPEDVKHKIVELVENDKRRHGDDSR
ncbi:PH domain-containing protein [Candidatus Uhrbacteria bacterium]|jgi:membrane protein YdbS with pleckstrin-like domain|nr:PH domain-containing protein [Candidatus Uhrbacteria bacterium]